MPRILHPLPSVIVAVAASAVQPLGAQQFPLKPIRVVVPFPPGGIADLYGRQVGTRMTQSWEQQVLIDNRPGAGGNIGAEIVAKSPADGYSLVIGNIGSQRIGFSNTVLAGR